MSIAPRGMKNTKVRKDLNLCFASGATLVIKVLADLENEPDTFFYRHVGPKGPKETTRKKNGSRSGSTTAKQRGGQAPALRGCSTAPCYRSARACPTPSIA